MCLAQTTPCEKSSTLYSSHTGSGWTRQDVRPDSLALASTVSLILLSQSALTVGR